MGGTIKVRLKAGDSEIEIEGEAGEVDQALDKWWRPIASADASSGKARAPAKKQASRSGTRKRKPAKSSRSKGEKAADDDFDANALANKIKDDEQFGIFEKKIIHPRADWYNKAAFVIWFAERELTSGQIHSVTQALDIKGVLPRISVALNDNRFIPSETRRAGATGIKYRLSAPEKTKFEKWLLSQDEDENGGE